MDFNNKHFFNIFYRFSIRKTSLGVGSVMVGMLLASGLLHPPQVYANELDNTSLTSEEGSEAAGEQTQPETDEALTSDTPETRPEVLVQPVAFSAPASTTDTPPAEASEASVTSPETWHKVNSYNETNKTVNFDNDWKFSLGDKAGAAEASYDDSSWKLLNLPHDFSLSQDYTASGEAESGYKPGGVGWYRKSFSLGEEAQKGRVSLHFDGSYMETEVFINGQSLGVHPNGYTSFSFDLTDYLLKDQENSLAVKVTNKIPSSRWYSGSGIYRSVQLQFTPQVHLAEYGVVAKTPDLATTYNQASGSTLAVATHVLNQSDSNATVTVRTSLFERQADGSLGTQVGETSSQATTISANGNQKINTSLKVVQPKLWSLDTPNLYVLRTEILDGDKVIQSSDQETGFRYTNFDANHGFSLNGQNIKLKGVSMHHDQGALGASAYYDAIERQVTILKDMGVNAIRVTHNPAARALKDIANRKGMLIIDEAFDGWRDTKNGNTYDYARFFDQAIGNSVKGLANVRDADQTWAEYHIKQMVRSGINDPSIIMWSTGNEVMEGTSDRSSSTYPALIAQLINWIDEIDGTRPATLGDNKLKGSNRNSIGMAEALAANEKTGIIGYNYANGQDYDTAHRRHPDWLLYGSETASSINSRGVYDIKTGQRSDKQLTSYDKSKVGWGAFASEAWLDVIKRDFIAGEFVWTGFDYLGEPTPWNNVSSGVTGGHWPSPKSSYFGIVDTAGFPKDSYYFYRSQWNDKDTTLHLLPGAWNESVIAKDRNNNVEVVVYSNAKKVKLVHVDANGRETDLGTKEFTTVTTEAGHTYQIYNGSDKSASEHQNLYLTWNVAYQPGTLKAIAYDANGRKISDTTGTKSVTSFGDASKLLAKLGNVVDDKVTDHSLAYIEIDVQDANGNLITNGEQVVNIAVTGPAKLIAMDNGNAVDHQSYLDSNRKAFGGKVLAIVQMTGQSGHVTVTASSNGLKSSQVTFDVVGADKDYVALDSYKLAKTVYVRKGQTPTLPNQVTIKDSNQVESIRSLTFDHQKLQEGLATGRDFIIKGQIADSKESVEVLVSVIDQIGAIKNISLATERGQKPSLPQTAQVYLADGTLLSSQFPVAWSMPADSAFDTEGVVVISGMADVLGEKRPVTASVRVASKSLAIDSNVAPLAATVSATTTSDTLEAITDKSRNGLPGTGGVNPSIWSNYAKAQTGDPNATISFTYDTAQNIKEVNLVFNKDSWALRYPAPGKELEAVNFTWSTIKGGTAEPITATVLERRELDNNDLLVRYSLNKAVPAVVFNLNVSSTNEDLGNRKTAIGLSEVELMTAVEDFRLHNDAQLTSLSIGDKTFTGRALKNSIETAAKGDITASNDAKNVAVTILPEHEGRILILTESEDKTKQAVYTIETIPESPRTDDQSQYIPTSETSLTVGSVESRPGNEANNALDANPATIWHSAWAGTDLDNMWATIDTGKVRNLNGLAYMGRQDGSPNGKITDYEIFVSEDNNTWTSVARGRFTAGNDWQEVGFTPTSGRYIKLKALHTSGDGGRQDRFISAAELRAREAVAQTPAPVETAVGKLETVALPSLEILENIVTENGLTVKETIAVTRNATGKEIKRDVVMTEAVSKPAFIELPEGKVDVTDNTIEHQVGKPEMVALPSLEILENIVTENGLTIKETIAVTRDTEGKEIKRDVLMTEAVSKPALVDRPEFDMSLLTKPSKPATDVKPMANDMPTATEKPATPQQAMTVSSAPADKKLPATGDVEAGFSLAGGILLGLMGLGYKAKKED